MSLQFNANDTISTTHMTSDKWTVKTVSLIASLCTVTAATLTSLAHTIHVLLTHWSTAQTF